MAAGMKKKTMLAMGAGAAALGGIYFLSGGARLGDMVSSLQIGKKKKETRVLCTSWSEEADDGPEAVPLPEYPRPQMVRKNWTCLNGWWEYSFRPAGEEMGDPDGKILVPFSPETDRSGVGRTLQPGETLWYSRMVEIPEVPAGHRFLLHFGAVDERCTIWWNDTEVGRHRNGYLPFTLDVTDSVRAGSNVLRAAVQDDTDSGPACRGKQTLTPGGMYYHAQSGIWQTVWMETVPETFLTDLRITPDLETEAVDLQLCFSGKEVMEAVITPEGGQPLSFTGRSGMHARIPVPDPHLWTPDDPCLYPFRIEVRRAEEQEAESAASAEGENDSRNSAAGSRVDSAGRAGDADCVESYFAMRSFGTGADEAGRPCLLLNGAPFFFHGVLDQGYWPESLMTAPADEAFVFDIMEMKKAGFNMLRKHVKVEAARWYYHCDRLGMVVWQDMVNGGGPVPKLLETYLPTVIPAAGDLLKDDHYALLKREDVQAREEFEEDLRVLVRTLYNVPAIGLWTLFNEGWGQFDALRLTELIREEDPTRPIDHASGWFDQGGGDVRSIHNYFRDLKVEKDPRAFVLSEYGGINCSIPGHAMSEDVYGYQKSDTESFPGTFRNLMTEIGGLRAEGLAGAVYTQVSDIEEETNGILTYDRKAVKLQRE